MYEERCRGFNLVVLVVSGISNSFSAKTFYLAILVIS
jgi:hypothetical protein